MTTATVLAGIPTHRFALVALLALAQPVCAQNPGDCLVQSAAFQSAGGGCKDTVANIAFSAIQPQQTWDGANQICANLVEGGFSDWRLPTIAEMQAAAAHGAAAHLDFAVFARDTYRYSSRTQGQWAQNVRLTDGAQKKILKSSWLSFFCVRTAASSLVGLGTSTTSGPSLSATHLFDHGVWTTLLHAPQHQGVPYVILAGLRDDTALGGIANPVLLGPGVLPTAFFQPGSGRLDAAGRTAVSVDLLGLGVPGEAFRMLALAIVVLDPRQPEWAVYPFSAAAGG